MASTPSVVQTPKLGLAQIENADGQTLQTLLTGAANGTKVTGVVATGEETSDRDLQLVLVRSATEHILATVTVPLTAGRDASVPAVNLLAAAALPGLPLDNDGQRYLFLEENDLLQVRALTAVTSAEEVSVAAIAGDF